MGSQDYFKKIINLSAPQWAVPQTVKDSYTQAIAADKKYLPQINSALYNYGQIKPVTSDDRYGKLVDLYNREYKNNATLAAAETVKESLASNAGYGDSYSQAASDQAYNGYMAESGATLPQLLGAAAGASSADREALANGIAAMQQQRSTGTAAAQQLFANRLSDAQKEFSSRQQAFNQKLEDYNDLYSYYKSSETGFSGGSGGGGRISSGYSSGGGGSESSSSSGSTSKKTNHQYSPQDLTNLYNKAIKNNPGLAKIVVPPTRYLMNQMGSMSDYLNYLETAINSYKPTVIAAKTFFNKSVNSSKVKSGNGPLK